MTIKTTADTVKFNRLGLQANRVANNPILRAGTVIFKFWLCAGRCELDLATIHEFFDGLFHTCWRRFRSPMIPTTSRLYVFVDASIAFLTKLLNASLTRSRCRWHQLLAADIRYFEVTLEVIKPA
ncbi:hypothetical protein D3C87_1293530 [compost metagenome]